MSSHSKTATVFLWKGSARVTYRPFCHQQYVDIIDYSDFGVI
jgi:hypothetical protein